MAELIVPPMVPTVQSEGDSSNFDCYPDEQADEETDEETDEEASEEGEAADDTTS